MAVSTREEEVLDALRVVKDPDLHRDIVALGLRETRGNYKIVGRIFNMEARDYKRFLNFLRKHDCQIPFKDYR